MPAEISVPDSNSLLQIQPHVCGLNRDLGSNTCKTHQGLPLLGSPNDASQPLKTRGIAVTPAGNRWWARGVILGVSVSCLD